MELERGMRERKLWEAGRRTNLGEESVKVLRLGETVLANDDVLHFDSVVCVCMCVEKVVEEQKAQNNRTISQHSPLPQISSPLYTAALLSCPPRAPSHVIYMWASSSPGPFFFWAHWFGVEHAFRGGARNGAFRLGISNGAVARIGTRCPRPHGAGHVFSRHAPSGIFWQKPMKRDTFGERSKSDWRMTTASAGGSEGCVRTKHVLGGCRAVYNTEVAEMRFCRWLPPWSKNK